MVCVQVLCWLEWIGRGVLGKEPVTACTSLMWPPDSGTAANHCSTSAHRGTTRQPGIMAVAPVGGDSEEVRHGHDVDIATADV